MFENFVHFQEVTKLSSIVYYQMKRVNFSQSVFDLIRSRNHYQFVKELFDLLLENNLNLEKYLIKLTSCCYQFEEEFLKGIFSNVILNKERVCINTNLFIFCCRHDCLFEFIEKLISLDVNIHHIQDLGLLQACSFGQIKTVKFLIDKGCNLNPYDNCMLHSAIRNNHFEVVKYLVENGVDIFDDSLEIAIKSGYVEIADYLNTEIKQFLKEHFEL